MQAVGFLVVPFSHKQAKEKHLYELQPQKK